MQKQRGVNTAEIPVTQLCFKEQYLKQKLVNQNQKYWMSDIKNQVG